MKIHLSYSAYLHECNVTWIKINSFSFFDTLCVGYCFETITILTEILPFIISGNMDWESFSYQYPIADETTSAICPKEHELGAHIASLSLPSICKSSGGTACHDDPNLNLILLILT